MTSATTAANPGTPCFPSSDRSGSTRSCPRLGVPVWPHLQPPPLPGCDSQAVELGPARRPKDWQLSAPIRGPPEGRAGPRIRVALSVQVEAPGGAKWQEPLKGREPRRARTRGPARPGQVPARSLPCAAQVSLDRLRGRPSELGRDMVQDPEAGSQGPGPSRERRAQGHRIPGVGVGGPRLHAPNLRSPGVLESQS